jgi:hypothetical protein
MSAFAVRDVTAYYTESSSLRKTSNVTQSSITPFQKILEKEETEQAKSTSQKVDSADTGKVTKASDTSGNTSVSLQDIFERASEKYNISYDFLVAVAKAESDFDTTCVSSAGAKGIMQLMPDECKELGVTDPFDAEQNIMAAAKLLKAHLKKFDGDYTLAAAAYNAGSGAVKKYGGVPPYTETQNYVKKISKYMKEGVTVPDKTVKVSSSSSSEGEGGATTVTLSKSELKKSVEATDTDLEGVTVSVGTGESKVTMSYGAYLKYIELGTTGVG